MFCTVCGTANKPESNYCKKCGHALEPLEAGAPAGVTEPVAPQPAPAPHEAPEENDVSDAARDAHVGALLERGYRMRSAGDSAAAVMLVEEALRLCPQSTTGHSLLAQLYQERGDQNGAILEMERVVALNPGSIADRLKLDQLRAAPTRPTPEKKAPPSGRPIRRSVVIGLAVAAGVLICGGVIGIMKLARSPEPAPRNESSTRVPSGVDSTASMDAARGYMSGGAAPYQPAIIAPPTGASTLASPAAPVTPAPASPAVGGATYPTVATPQAAAPNATARALLPAPASVRMARQPLFTAAPLTVVRSRTRPPANTRPTPSKVTLPGEGGAEHIDIRVSPSDVAGHHTPAPTRPTPVRPGNIRIVVYPDAPRAASEGADSNARSNLTMGAGLMREDKYDSAINAFHNALTGAGVETAYTYQQIGRCYYLRGDHASAKTNYERAINEYLKLQQAGHNVESAKTGAKVCEKAIVLCDKE